MIETRPVPEGLLQHALNTAFTTESWPEWDELELVPQFDGDATMDDLDFATDAGGDDGETASKEAEADTADADSAVEPNTGKDSEEGDLTDLPTAFDDSPHETGDQFDPFDQIDLNPGDFDFS